MKDFPVMKQTANRIATSSQATPGVEGYVFDGADGSQMAFWTCHLTASSAPHAHDYDEYMLVIQGRYTLIVEQESLNRNGFHSKLEKSTLFPVVCCMAERSSRARGQYTHSAATERIGFICESGLRCGYLSALI